MLKETLKESSIVYYSDYCEKCGGVSHWGELVPVKIETVSPSTLKEVSRWAYVCPKCYIEATRPKKFIITSLRDPERLEELLERYKEE